MSKLENTVLFSSLAGLLSFVQAQQAENLITVPVAVSSFCTIDTLQLGKSQSYYTVLSDESGNYIHAHYLPPGEPVRLGYKVPDSLKGMETFSWQWLVKKPPVSADERVRGKNDSGAAVYLLFKNGLIIYIIKYVYSTSVPCGTTISRNPLYPFQLMTMVVMSTWNEAERGKWHEISVNFKDDFKRLFKSKTCPQLSGVGIMSDGDGTSCEIIAGYRQFSFSGGKK